MGEMKLQAAEGPLGKNKLLFSVSKVHSLLEIFLPLFFHLFFSQACCQALGPLSFPFIWPWACGPHIPGWGALACRS